ncbi:MAG: hypothetical protein MK097_15045, partial [Dechloromonas sp.]|nr:hypothetical protein [Dechloromonas sp.]
MNAVEPRLSDLVALDTLIAGKLAPRVTAIDLEGEYPESFLRAAGQLGAFVGQRLGMGFQREVDDVAHAQRRQPRHVLVLDPAGGGNLRVEPLPG